MFTYFLFIAPAILLALWAQMRVKSTYAQAQRVPAQLSGAAAARFILDSAGLQNVAIEPVRGQLSDHYDPRVKVLRLSEGVYGHRSMAAVGIAAHEAGHAIQDGRNYAPLVIRNAAVPVANFGGNISIPLIFIGAIMHLPMLIWGGIILFAGIVAFQLVNLPVEFDASARAKRLLVEQGIVDAGSMQYVDSVLNAAAWTYVAATLHSVMTLLFYVLQFTGSDE